MKPRPAFSMYAAEFFSDTAALSQAEVGALVRIMCQYWRHGKMPDNLEAWALGEVTDAVLQQLEVERERLDELRAECEALSEARSKAARERWDKPEPMPMPEPKPKPEPRPDWMTDDMFDAWQRFQKHRAEKKSKLTPSARDAMFRKWKEWGEKRMIAAIDHSIANGWAGCFEPKSSDIKRVRPFEPEVKDLKTTW